MNDLRVWGTTRAIPGVCFVIEVAAPGLLVVKHHRGEESGKFVNVAVLEGDQIKVIDEDLAHSGAGVLTRNGFTQMTHDVAMGQVGIILCLEASRIARNNAEWYRLLELCGVTDTLIGDLDGLGAGGTSVDQHADALDVLFERVGLGRQ